MAMVHDVNERKQYRTSSGYGEGIFFSMQLIKLVVCISVLVTRICSAELIIKTSELDESSLIEESIDILESCYADRFSTVGLAGPAAGGIVAKISSRDSVISATLIDETLRIARLDPVKRESRYKLQVFMVTTTNQEALRTTITQVKRSKWWNHMASFLLVDLRITENGCSNAAGILLEAWKMDMLNSKFVCLHRMRGQLIYTFNPFTSKAPVPWQQEATYTAENGHPWTLFVREYREVKFHCDGLDFDKTVDLGGYAVRASVSGMETWWFANPKKKPFLINQVANVTAQILMSSLNVTWKLLARPFNNFTGINLKTGEPVGGAAEVTSGISDICLNLLIQQDFVDFETTYPLFETNLGILTQYPGNKSQLDKLASVLDRPSRAGVFLVLIITLLFFKFWLGRPLTEAILDIVLIVCNASLPKIPEKLAPRIYLCALFILVVTIQGIYSGVFAALLTKEVRLSTIDTIEDLARSKHTIHGQEAYRILFNQSAFEGRYFALTGPNCTAYPRFDSNAACVDVMSTLIDYAGMLNLHVSREPIGHMYGVYLIRPDFPLEERVNLIFARAAAGGIAETLYNYERDSRMNRVKSYEEKEQDPAPKVLTLKQLTFAFVILGIGLGSATIVFILEVALFHKKIANPRRHIQR